MPLSAQAGTHDGPIGERQSLLDIRAIMKSA